MKHIALRGSERADHFSALTILLISTTNFVGIESKLGELSYDRPVHKCDVDF
jgi:hypothetical protein